MKKSFILSTLILCACQYGTPPLRQNIELENVNFRELWNKKVGTECNTIIFGFIPVEVNDGIARAAWNAGITKVSYVEYYSHDFWPLFIEDCIKVYGD